MSDQKAVLFLVPAAVAVAVGLTFLRLHFQPPTVPPYELDGPAGVAVLTPQSSFEMVMRPREPVSGAVGARGFLVRGDSVRPWSAIAAVALDGTVRIAGPVEYLFAGVPPGQWEIVVAVGRPEVLPTAPREVLAYQDHDERVAGWRAVREPIRIEAP